MTTCLIGLDRFRYDLETETLTRVLPGCEQPDCYADEPAYSPDGMKLAFIRYHGPLVDDVPSDCGLWLGDLATGEVTQIASNPRCDNGYHHPRWSPDGRRLVVMRERADHPGGPTAATAISVIDADGANEEQLTAWEAMAPEPVGRRLLRPGLEDGCDDHELAVGGSLRAVLSRQPPRRG